MHRGDGVRLRLGAEGARRRASGPSCSVDPRALVASMLYYWVPEERRAHRGRAQAARRHRGPVRAGRRHRPCTGTGTSPRWRPSRAAERPPDLGAVHRGVGRRAPGGRRARVDVPQRRPRLEHRHRAGRAPRPAHRRVHDHVPARGPAARGDARRRVYARKMAAHLGIRLHEIEISPDVVDLLPRIVDMLDEPIGDPAAINTVLMCEAARDAGVKVLLSGMGADELFGGYRKHLACLLGRPLPAAAADAARRVVRAGGRPAAGRGRRAAGLRHSAVGQAVPHLRRAARGGGVPAQLHALRPRTSSSTCSTPSSPATSTRWSTEHRDVYHDTSSPTTSTGCASPTPGCSCPASTSRTPTGRAWPPPPRCGCRSSTRSSSGPRSPSLARARSAAATQKVAAQDGGRRSGCRARSSTGRRRPSARRCAPGSPTTSATLVDDVLARRASSSARACCARPRCARLVADERSRPRGPCPSRSGSCCSMELWYRTVRTAGVAGMLNWKAMKQVAQNYRSGELAVLDVPRPGVQARRRAGALAVLAHLDRHRDDEGRRGAAVAARQGARPAGPGAQGARHRRAAGRRRDLPEGDEPARLLHAARVLAVRCRRRGRRRAPRSSPSVSWSPRAGNEFALHAEVNWVPGQPLRPGARRRRARARRVRHRRRDRHAGRPPRRGRSSARPRA